MEKGNITKVLRSHLDGDESKMWACAELFDAAMCALAGVAPEHYTELTNELHIVLFGKHFDEVTARTIVSEMMHTDAQGAEFIGEHYTADFVSDLQSKHMQEAALWDIYVALNATWHDFAVLFSKWFTTPTDQHFVEATKAFWFDDEDYGSDTKVWDYFN